MLAAKMVRKKKAEFSEESSALGVVGWRD